MSVRSYGDARLPDDPQFDVALSFAGEQRSYVRRVASALIKQGVNIYFDEEQEIENWGKNLVEEFQRVFQDASRVVVMFISQEYVDKEWTRHERRSALSRAIRERREYVLPVRFDNAAVPGLDSSFGYLSLSEIEPEDLAAKIAEKLVRLGGRIVAPALPEFRNVPADTLDNPSEVLVLDSQGIPILDAQVVMVAHNGTETHGSTDTDGAVRFTPRVRRKVSVFVAHRSYPAAYLRDHDNSQDLVVTLPDGNGVGSVAFTNSTGYIPGFRPRLNPIGDAHDKEAVPRKNYMYVDNSSVNGRSEQPFHIRIGEPLLLEDADGNHIRITLVGFVGRYTLWEYRSPK